jgi:hypothetical protein
MQIGNTGGGNYSGIEVAKQKAKAPLAKSGTVTKNNPNASGPGSGSVALAAAVGEDIDAASTGIIVEEWNPILMALLAGEGL